MSNDLRERLFWLVRLRWIAILGVIGVLAFTGGVLQFDLPYFMLYALVAALAFCNLIFYWLTNLIIGGKSSFRAGLDRLANIQISLDLLFLALLVHFSGGIENPFIFYFIFHIIIAGILLSRRASFLQAAFAVLLLLFLVVLEYAGVLPHYTLRGFAAADLYQNILYLSGTAFVFISTIFIAAYMASSIAKRLKEVNESLREKDRVKSEYVLRVSHDIKEHLAAITSCLEPVVDGFTGPLAEKQKELLARARDRVQKLIFFVRALLDITRLKLTEKLQPEQFSFQAMLQDLAEDLAILAQEKKISLKFEITPAIDKISGVRVYLEEALSNVLVNAIKYTPLGGEVRLIVTDGGEKWLIEIEDNGIGIADGDLPFIFDEFYRAKNARAIEKMGTGLGLAISKKIMEMHQGRIRVKSEVGKGTAFYLELPK